jgi:hypothetical protein
MLPPVEEVGRSSWRKPQANRHGMHRLIPAAHLCPAAGRRSRDTTPLRRFEKRYSNSSESGSLAANSTFDLRIVPAIPRFRNWNVTVSCDNGTETQATTFF